ncbi:MAG: hypothetical protein JWN00_6214 [Actinomycetia bacterium]|nr:hypothetical protein [Actinomycetes bacterium]
MGRRTVLIVSLGLALAGCSSGTAVKVKATRASVQVPTGMHRVTGLDGALSVGVPDTWTNVDLAPAKITASLKHAGLKDPAAKAQLEQLQALRALYALDIGSRARSSARFGTNLNAFCTDSPGTDVKALKQAAPGQMQRAGGQQIQVTDVTVDGLAAIRVAYGLTGGSLSGLQVQVPVKGKVCSITFTTDQPARYQPVFDAMIPTIRLPY